MRYRGRGEHNIKELEDIIDELNERVSNSASVACYVALYTDSTQIAEDSWRPFTRTKTCGPKTTLEEIMEWSKGNNVEISEAT